MTHFDWFSEHASFPDDPELPKAHVEVGLLALEAGKHVYSWLGVRFEDGKRLVEQAREKGLRVGSAPDTFLGGAHQTCRRLVDDGRV